MAFTFGGAGSGGTSNAFGQSPAPAPSGAPTTNSFGQPGPNTTANSNQTSGLFGKTTTANASPFSFGAPASTGGPSLFGSTTTSGSAPLFGSSTAKPGSGSNILGGTAPGNTAGSTATPGAGIFGAGVSASKPPSFGSNFSFDQNAAQKTGSSTPANNTFPAPAQAATPATSSNVFGGANKTAGSGTSGAPILGSTTPAASRPSGSMFNFAPSTTPAGTPAGNGNAKGPGPLFSGLNKPAGGLFGASKPPDATPSTVGSQPNMGAMFGGLNPTATTGSSFGGGTGALKSDAAPKTTTSTTDGSTSAFNFAPNPSATSVPPASAASKAAPTATTSPFATGGSGTSTGQTSGLFGTGAATSAPPASTTAPASTSLFSGLGPKPVATASEGTPTSTAATSTPGMFGAKAATTTPGPVTGGTAATAPPGTTTTPGINNPSVSTAGPAPQMSRLKNRTMDEIISRWANDLSKYQKDFQDQATKVASWDRLLVENGDKIQKLYVSTFEAERATSEVEKQLTTVENLQGELEGWLDRYEQDVDELFNRNLGSSDNLQGPDQERERTYKLAERLAERLDEMGKDLTSMIQEINTASASLSKTGKPDDPVSLTPVVIFGLPYLTLYSYSKS